MKRIALGLIAAALAIWPGVPGNAQTQHIVDVADLDGVIDPTSASHLSEVIQRANQDGAEVVIVQVDTPGGLDVSMRDMVQEILRSPVPVVVWVGPQGARAASAGVFLVYASHVAAMAPGTNVGAAHPVDLGGGDVEQKIVNDAAAYLRSLAEQRGRDPEFAEDAVKRSASITAAEAKERGVVELLAPSVPDLMIQLDGRTVLTDAGPRTLVTRSAPGEEVTIRFHEMGILRRILHAVTDPSVAYLLLVLGFWAIVFELSQPGLGIAGVAGAVSLILAFYSLAVLPVNIAALLLVLLGLVLFTIDVFVAGLGVFTVGGAIALAVGSFLLFAGVSPVIEVSPWLIGAVVLSSVLFFGFAMTVAMRVRRRQSITGQEALVGMTGETRADLNPEGHVWVKGAIWKARAVNGPIVKGRRVRVRRVDGLMLLVQEEKEEK